jgi:hypothetical protein
MLIERGGAMDVRHEVMNPETNGTTGEREHHVRYEIEFEEGDAPLLAYLYQELARCAIRVLGVEPEPQETGVYRAVCHAVFPHALLAPTGAELGAWLSSDGVVTEVIHDGLDVELADPRLATPARAHTAAGELAPAPSRPLAHAIPPPGPAAPQTATAAPEVPPPEGNEDRAPLEQTRIHRIVEWARGRGLLPGLREFLLIIAALYACASDARVADDGVAAAMVVFLVGTGFFTAVYLLPATVLPRGVPAHALAVVAALVGFTLYAAIGASYVPGRPMITLGLPTLGAGRFLLFLLAAAELLSRRAARAAELQVAARNVHFVTCLGAVVAIIHGSPDGWTAFWSGLAALTVVAEYAPPARGRGGPSHLGGDEASDGLGAAAAASRGASFAVA